MKIKIKIKLTITFNIWFKMKLFNRNKFILKGEISLLKLNKIVYYNV